MEDNHNNNNNGNTVRINTEVLATQMEALRNQVNKLESKLDAYATHFITSEVYELKHRELELGLTAVMNRVQTIEKELEVKTQSIYSSLRRRDRNNTVRTVIVGIVSASAGIILAFLIEFYLSHVK